MRNCRKLMWGSLHLQQHSLYASRLTELRSSCFAGRNILQRSPSCLLIATNLLIPEGWALWLTVAIPGIEPGPAGLVVYKIRQRATVSTRPCRQTNCGSAENVNHIHQYYRQYNNFELQRKTCKN